jgi:hypothetical protein
MAVLARYPVSISVVLAALTATTAVFLFARPQYHPKGEGSEVKLDLSKYPPAAEGWHWDAQPGFRFGEDEDEWNLSQVKPTELTAVRAAARRNGIAPASVRVLDAIRLGGPRDLSLIVAGTNAAAKTCLGFATPTSTSFSCPPDLYDESAFLLVTTRNRAQAGLPTFLTGIASGDVTRVVVNQPDDWPNVGIYRREQGSAWGTFELSLSNGKGVDVTVVRADGGSRTVHIDETTPGDRVVAIG